MAPSAGPASHLPGSSHCEGHLFMAPGGGRGRLGGCIASQAHRVIQGGSLLIAGRCPCLRGQVGVSQSPPRAESPARVQASTQGCKAPEALGAN